MEKVNRVSAKEQVLSALRKAIFKGDLKPKQEIRQEEIANMLGVSRMPVREAFQILDREGIIKIHDNRRVMVVGLKTEDVWDHYTIRAFLEGMATEKACKSPGFFEELTDIHQQIIRAAENNDSKQYIQLNADFHNAIWRASKSIRLYALLSDLWNGLQPQLPEFVSFQMNKAIEEHGEILQAILDQDPEVARKHMEHHVNRSKEDFLDHFYLN